MKNNNLESVIADTDNLEMTPEMEQEINKIYEEKEVSKMKKSNETIFNEFIESIVREYKNVEDLKIYENIEGFSSKMWAIEILSTIQKDFLYSKNTLTNCISSFIGTNGLQDASYLYGKKDLYNCYEIPILTVADENYEECLLNWVADLEKHLYHLFMLVIHYNKENINTLMQCYIETAILCKKLTYAIDQAMRDFDSLTPDEHEFYNIEYGELNFVRSVYGSIERCLDSLVVDLFNYFNTFEKNNNEVVSNEIAND